jgi:hypothetical protein
MTITFDKEELEKLAFSDLKAMLEFAEEQKQAWSDINKENKSEKNDKEIMDDLETWHYWSLIGDAINTILTKKITSTFKEYQL